LQAREEQLEDLFKQAKNRLGQLVADEKQYTELLKKLLLQGLLQLMEKEVVIVGKQKHSSKFKFILFKT
jgi:V-type H+-transporting ATPase subunit E